MSASLAAAAESSRLKLYRQTSLLQSRVGENAADIVCSALLSPEVIVVHHRKQMAEQIGYRQDAKLKLLLSHSSHSRDESHQVQLALVRGVVLMTLPQKSRTRV